MAINKVLVVDDAKTDRTNLENILRESGYQVATATSGREALESVSSNPPDLIFMDVVMEDMDGYQACRKLTTGDATKHIPVVIVSANKQKVDRLWAQKQGARAYVTKPYTAEEIAAQIQKFS